MKKIMLIIISLLFIQVQEGLSQTFNFEWALVAQNNMTGGDVAVDANGNVFVAGYSGIGLIVSKYSPSGSLVGNLSIATNAQDGDKAFVSIDNNNNVVVVGKFAGTTDFQPGLATYELTPTASYSIFIAKYDNALSNLVFANAIADELVPKAFAISASNDIYLTYRNITGNSTDSFIARFDSDGNEIWEFEINASSGHVRTTDIRVNDQNELFIGGYLWNVNQAPDFDPDPNDTWTNVGGNVFYAKYTTDMDFVWVKGINVGNANEVRIAYANGNLFVASTGNGDIDPNPSVLSVSGSYFVGKYSSSTGEIIWGRGISTTTPSGGGNTDDDVFDLEVTPQDRILVSGAFYGSEIIFDGSNPNGIHPSASQGGYDGFIAAYDMDNNYLGGLTMMTTASSWAKSIVADNSGSIYCGGYYYGTTDFDPNGTFNLYSPTNDPQLFLAKYSGLITSIEADSDLKSMIVYPNPSSTQFELVLPEFDNSSYQLFDNLGRSVASGNLVAEKTTIDVRSFSTGIYMLQLRTPQGVVTRKLVRQ